MTGGAGDTMLNRALLVVIELNVSGAPPLAPIVNFRSLLWPETTLPKSMEAALRLIAGAWLSNAVPASATFTLGRLGSPLVSARAPCCDPVAVGVQRTAIARWPPAGMTRLPAAESRANGPEEI